MDSKSFENALRNDIEDVFTSILSECNFLLSISARSRSGAEISDYLEDAFVLYMEQNKHTRISNSQSAPKDKTKNPYDIKFEYTYSDHSIEIKNELIWADIKASKKSYADSNPDIGTPTKVINFLKKGHFYLIYVMFEYIATENNETQFVKLDNDKYVKVIFLKNIHRSVRVNPKPQLQVNFKMPEEYRTKKEFIDLLETKYYESLDRITKNVANKRVSLKDDFDEIRNLYK